MTTQQKEFLTVQEAANEIGISDSRLRHLLNEEKPRIKASKFGKSWMLKSDEVKRFKSLNRSPGNPNFSKAG